MKKIKYLLFCTATLLFTLPLLSNAQSGTALFNKKDWIHFSWEGMKLGDRFFDKAAIIVPFNIDGINTDFTLQFDLGATSSMLYGNSINYFLAKDAAFAAKLDTTNKRFMLEGKMQGSLNDLHTRIDGKPAIFKNSMAYFKGYGETLTDASVKPGKPVRIGTLGAPFFADKVLIIDYPNKRFMVTDSLDKATGDKFEFLDCRLENSRIKIPFTVGSSVYWVMFDTGSSLFSIMTNKTYYDQLTGNTPVDSLGIPSWGKILEVYGRRMNKPLQFGTVTLPQSYVYMMAGNIWDNFYKQEGIIGITGNALFLDKVIAIDFKHKKFGVYKYGPLKQ